MNENGDCINPPKEQIPLQPAESQEKTELGPVGGPDTPTKCYSPGTRDYNHDGCVCKVKCSKSVEYTLLKSFCRKMQKVIDVTNAFLVRLTVQEHITLEAVLAVGVLE